ncbi:quinoprotein glucose dehydrogenase [Marine Group I thaumarchaeote SCGC AAA799-E16]|uniref:Quinoprotein glucose dehydrogenase n=4 Tax=Marine Group I TaxID=905826 RepID=A0A081RM12_9ARCH|nr:quinoprotein glucose dehydrogenase [Marine Group I thaumarchaeote SCGC AAA799-N04]KER06348.1 quinoprotein glucose dehydrogenase [Marine Group I thaumarchaeote SCGC AAA799-E16]KFM17238.1 quinoprotein glucose dehydrogenase [Marine Group I thaumarchaeote SCGC AAA799-D11]KFM19095.1 quinoprotein glucose dehydrogenase [Marine Group I thaumarchaeote SCGC RSA3]
MKIVTISFLIIFAMVGTVYAQEFPELGVKVDVVADNLKVPWAIDFASDGRMFFTERVGNVNVIENGEVNQIMSLGVGGGEGGMLGIALDPNFDENHYIYIYYTYNEFLGIKNRLVQYSESNNVLTEEKVLIEGIPGAPYHDGGRIKFGPDGMLYVTTGDAVQPDLSQDLNSVAGKILRINSDGSIPDGNPFDSAVYSIGHRNPQGIAWDESGNLVATEHGPSGWRGVAHDEINLIVPGANYGWPDVIGDEVMKGATNPILHSGDDTWAPSGSTFYYGDEMPMFDGKYFAAALKGEHIHIIEFDENFRVPFHGELFSGEFGRIRDVTSGPDGLYFMTSNQDGRGNPNLYDDKILRISPLYDYKSNPWIQNISEWHIEGLISKQESLEAHFYLEERGIISQN